MVEFRAKKGDILFQDGEDCVIITYLQRRNGSGQWDNVLELHLEGGRAWGDKIDLLYRHRLDEGVLLAHIAGFGFWGDAEYYRSDDHGITWEPTRSKREPDPAVFKKEEIPQV
jgi:hypothetical protein